MNIFKIKLLSGIFIFFMIILLSYTVYWRNVSALHDQMFETLDTVELMHTAETFHTSLHNMVVITKNYVTYNGGTDIQKEYEENRRAANNALNKLEFYTGYQSFEEHADISSIEALKQRFLLLQSKLDSILAGQPSNADVAARHLCANRCPPVIKLGPHALYLGRH